MIFQNSCIEHFILNLGEEDLNKYVVSGLVTDQEGYQKISVALASSLDEPEFIPLINCNVRIYDNQGNMFTCEEFNEGKYRVWMEEKFLNPGTSYMLKIKTPSGVQLESSYDMMPKSPEIDSIYYVKEEIQTYNPDFPINGIQFYIDIQATEQQSRYYRWELTETWEYNAEYAKILYYDGGNFHNSPPDSSSYFCWKTESINDIYTLSTENLSENRYKKLPLNYVNNKSSRLDNCYSLLVKQYAISDSAYHFWNALEVNSNNQAQLYEQQPMYIEGNLKNISRPELKVLGFFSACAVNEKRIFAQDLEIETDYLYCLEYEIDALDYSRENWPVYYHRRRVYMGAPVNDWVYKTYLLSGICIDCTYEGGITQKPSFWPY